MLASQMNPTMVCTTALLCNNAWVDGLLSEYKSALKAKTLEQVSNDGKCESCRAFMSHNAMKVQSSSQVDLQNILFNVSFFSFYFLITMGKDLHDFKYFTDLFPNE